MLKLLVLKFVHFFGCVEVIQSLEKYAQLKSDYYRGIIKDKPLAPTCPIGLGLYDIAIWAYAVNLYDYIFFTVLGTFAFLAMIGHMVFRLIFAIL